MDKHYNAAMIVIGNEILSGRTQDLNINYVASKLVECGVTLSEVRIVPDEEKMIINAIHSLIDHHDYIFTSGGIGPTHDDITAISVAKAFNVPLEENEEAYNLLLKHYGDNDLTTARLKMAQIPVGAQLIPNPVSAAPGFVIEDVYVLAGVPRIMQAMMDHVACSLKGGAVILSRTVPCSLSESVISEDLEKLQNEYPDVEIGSYPYFKDGKLGVNVVLRSKNEETLIKVERDVLDMVCKYTD